MNPIVAWLLALMLQFAPPGKAVEMPGFEETVEQRTARYQSIAEDIYTVVDRSQVHMLTRQQNAGLLLAVALGESELAKDTDVGPCFHGTFNGINYAHRCDGGKAVGIMQVQMPTQDAPLYFGDRKRLLAKALRGIAGSFGACRDLPFDERLAAYGAGKCDSDKGRAGSKKRMRTFEHVMSAKAVPKDWPKPVEPPAEPIKVAGR